MTEEPKPTEPTTPKPGKAKRPVWATALRAVIYLAILGTAGAWGWDAYGRKLWEDYQTLQKEVKSSEDNKPIGYLGLNYRRSYNDRPLVFVTETQGRKALFAAKRDGGEVETYDVTEAAFDVNCLEGGFGKDSIPGVDHPIVEAPNASPDRTLRDRQPVFGLEREGKARAYPKDLLEKIDVINDQLGGASVLILSDRPRGKAVVFDRTRAGTVSTFGTTGYSCKGRPVVYDRKTNSLWLPEGDALKCVNGALKGESLAGLASLDPILWADWRSKGNGTDVLVGNDRAKDVPKE